MPRGRFGTPVLWMFGPVQFEVYPFNVQGVDHTTGSDWARKEIAGAAIYREWVGEQDENIHLKGRLFPHYFAGQINRRVEEGGDTGRDRGGFSTLEVLDNMRRLGQAQILLRGDGYKMGWFVIDTLSRGHSNLAADGIGQQIDFNASFQRVPVPDAVGFFPELWGILGVG